MTNSIKDDTITAQGGQALPELYIIKLLLNINIYNKYIKYINLTSLKDRFKEIHQLYVCLADMHERIPNQESKSLIEFQLYFNAAYPALRKGEHEAFTQLFKYLDQATTSESSLEQVLEILAQRARAHELSLLSWEVAQGNRPQVDLEQAIADRREAAASSITKRNITYVTSRISELKAATVGKRGLRWPLHCLNLSLGSLRPGDFGFVFARPETGKTTFLCYCGTHMAAQAKAIGLGPVIYFSNEEQGEKVSQRGHQAYHGATLPQLYAGMDRFQSIWDKDVGDHFRIIDHSREPFDRYIIEDILEQEKPSLAIFDQIDKVEGFEADRPDLVFGQIYRWTREQAKGTRHESWQGCPAIGVCQSSGEGEGVKWLTMSHVAEAKTSKQAEADFIIGIGKTNDDGYDYIRGINISKNKLVGDEDSDPALRHGRFDVILRPEIARYEDILL